MVSVCTGAFVLGAVGLLDGRPAWTRWKYARRFARLYPKVALDVDVLYVDDILSSAGNFAGSTCVCTCSGGTSVARSQPRWPAGAWRDGGQSKFVDRPVPDPAGASTSAARAWAAKHLGEEMDIPSMATTAGTSVRSFPRHFRAETGISSGQ